MLPAEGQPGGHRYQQPHGCRARHQPCLPNTKTPFTSPLLYECEPPLEQSLPPPRALSFGVLLLWLHRGAPWGPSAPLRLHCCCAPPGPTPSFSLLLKAALPLWGCTQLPVCTRFLFAAPQRAQPRTPTQPDPQQKPPFLSSLAAATLKRLHPTAGHPKPITQRCHSSFPAGPIETTAPWVLRP